MTTDPIAVTPTGITHTAAVFDYQRRFEQGLPYREFLDRFANDRDRQRWQAVYDVVTLDSQQQAWLSALPRDMRLLCMAGTWCGDCVRQCPILQRFAEACPRLELRFVDRDSDIDLATELRICGAPRVPQVVFLNEDGEFVHRFGDRTLSQYRALAEKAAGAACATGIVAAGDESQRLVVKEWLAELERVALILRTSSKLRQRHGD